MQLFGVPEVCHTQRTHLHPVLRQVVYFIRRTQKNECPYQMGRTLQRRNILYFYPQLYFFLMFLTNFDGQVS